CRGEQERNAGARDQSKPDRQRYFERVQPCRLAAHELVQDKNRRMESQSQSEPDKTKLLNGIVQQKRARRNREQLEEIKEFPPMTDHDVPDASGHGNLHNRPENLKRTR